MKLFLILILVSFSSAVFGQLSELDSLELELQKLEQELENDSLLIIGLLESFADLESLNKSQISVRLSYSTEVSSAGRDFNINQSGFTPSVTYYHKSGIFGEVSGNIYTDLDPTYSLTTLSAGYSGFLGKKWNYLVSYDHFFFNETSEGGLESSDSIFFNLNTSNDLTNGINSSIFYDAKFLTLGLDYSFLFGEDVGHRLSPSISGNIKLPKFWSFKSVSFTPSFSVLFGNQTLIDQVFSRDAFNSGSREILQNLTFEERLAFLRQALNNSGFNLLDFRDFGEQRRLFFVERATLLAASELVDPFLFFETLEESSFCVLNYSLIFPVNLSTPKFNFSASYIYNFPQSLENEPEIDPYGYFRFSVGYSFGF